MRGFEHISNADSLVDNAPTRVRREVKTVLHALDKAIAAVQPDRLLRDKITVRGSMFRVGDKRLNLDKFDEVVLIGAGKAALGMAKAMLKLLGRRIKRGAIVVPYGSNTKALDCVKILEAGHPIPDTNGVRAAQQIIELAESCRENTLTIFLLSGGASALIPLPAEGISLEDKIEVTNLLLKSGATIHELNTVRKHISAIKGGQLAKALNRSRVVSLILSDVVGDDIATIGSGPTAPDATTYSDALQILERRGIIDKTPSSVLARLRRGTSGEIPETPKPSDNVFKRITNIVVGGNFDACKAAASFMRCSGYRSMIMSSHLEGEAREVGRVLSSIARSVECYDVPLRRPCAFVVGGETTVSVRGDGVGGRNQELVLSAVEKLAKTRKAVLASLGTDGIDGPTDAAGAICSPETLKQALRVGLSADDYLERNDSYNFFKKVGGLILTGRTGTNVGDVAILCVGV
ncbi:MAG: glycerate kinase [Aigarchaeota archaeon]|nr:glycerate kinase [Candidatus Pelearchaeum maunauluense]